MRPTGAPAVTVLIRFHTIRRLRALDEALFSLLGQTFAGVEARILCQDLPPADFEAVAALALTYGALGLRVYPTNEPFDRPGDHRAELLNRGLARVSTRYVAFLDSDDVLYPRCYERLVGRLEATDAAIAFGGVLRTDQFRAEGATHVRRKFRPLPELPKLLFFRCNQYPIHSYVIDRARIDRADAFFDVGQFRNEDYAFLVRLISKYAIDTVECRDVLCEYRVDIDGENTIPVYHEDRESRLAWDLSERDLDDLKARTPISTRWRDVLDLIAWCERDVAARTAAELGDLRREKRELEAALAERRARDGRVAAGLVALLRDVGDGWPAHPLTLNVERVEVLDADRRRLRGWCAGAGSPPMVLVVRQAGVAEAAACSVFEHRQDVADHLGTREAHFGFAIETSGSGGAECLCLCFDGRLYAGSIDPG